MRSDEIDERRQILEGTCFVDEPPTMTRTLDIDTSFEIDARKECLDQLHEALKLSEDIRENCKKLHFRTLSEFSKLPTPCDIQVYIPILST